MYVCICVLGHGIKCVSYCGHSERKVWKPLTCRCANLGLSFLEASCKRETLYNFCCHFLQLCTHTQKFFCSSLQRGKMNNMLNKLFTEDSGNLRQFLSTSHKWSHRSTLHKMPAIYPMCTLGPVTALYHACQCFYDC